MRKENNELMYEIKKSYIGEKDSILILMGFIINSCRSESEVNKKLKEMKSQLTQSGKLVENNYEYPKGRFFQKMLKPQPSDLAPKKDPRFTEEQVKIIKEIFGE